VKRGGRFSANAAWPSRVATGATLGYVAVTPTTEPSTAILLLAGLAMFLGWHDRKQLLNKLNWTAYGSA
jgi:hypothetical protein